MKIILAILLFPCLSHAQYRPYPISTMTPQALMNNFNQAAIRINRSLDKYGNDTIYGRPTFNKGAVFSSSVTFPTRDKIIFGNELLNSSSTNLTTNYTTSQNTFASCVTGSTLTITTNGGRLSVSMTGVVGIDTQTSGYASFTLDGSAQNAISGDTTMGVGALVSLGFEYKTGVLSSGSHTVCLSVKTNAGTMTLYGGGGVTTQFSVIELR